MLQSKAIGDIAEQEVVNYLNKIGFNAVKNNDKETRLYYDIVASYQEKIVTLEVKWDIKSSQTGNVAIEYFNSRQKKASGITATKADWWIQKVKGELYIISVADLKNFTEQVKPSKMITGGGDNNADLLIYPADIFTSRCKKLEEMELDDLL